MTFLAAVIALSSVYRATEIMANPDEDTKQWTMLSDRPPIPSTGLPTGPRATCLGPAHSIRLFRSGIV